LMAPRSSSSMRVTPRRFEEDRCLTVFLYTFYQETRAEFLCDCLSDCSVLQSCAAVVLWVNGTSLVCHGLPTQSDTITSTSESESWNVSPAVTTTPALVPTTTVAATTPVTNAAGCSGFDAVQVCVTLLMVRL
jgi:hypothetical protein